MIGSEATVMVVRGGVLLIGEVLGVRYRKVGEILLGKEVRDDLHDRAGVGPGRGQDGLDVAHRLMDLVLHASARHQAGRRIDGYLA